MPGARDPRPCSPCPLRSALLTLLGDPAGSCPLSSVSHSRERWPWGERWGPPARSGSIGRTGDSLGCLPVLRNRGRLGPEPVAVGAAAVSGWAVSERSSVVGRPAVSSENRRTAWCGDNPHGTGGQGVRSGSKRFSSGVKCRQEKQTALLPPIKKNKEKQTCPSRSQFNAAVLPMSVGG